MTKTSDRGPMYLRTWIGTSHTHLHVDYSSNAHVGAKPELQRLSENTKLSKIDKHNTIYNVPAQLFLALCLIPTSRQPAAAQKLAQLRATSINNMHVQHAVSYLWHQYVRNHA